MDTKWCKKGSHEVDTSLFSKNTRNKDGLFSWCKPCMAQYETERYRQGDSVRKVKNKALTVKRAQDYIWSVLTSSVCPCGQSDPLTLEFDHRDPKEKKYNISEMFNCSVAKIKQEIAKCDVLCASCHKKKTAIQFGFWRTFRD